MDALEDLDMGDGVADTLGVGGAARGHSGATDEVAADGKVDGDVFASEAAVHEGDVGLLELSRGEHLAELTVGAVVLGDDDDPAGLLVEAMDDAGAKVTADVREVVEVMEDGVDEGAVVAFIVGGA